MALSAEQVARYAKQAGFSGHNLVIAVAIAHAESGFRPTVLGDTTLETSTWGPSVGLWQIRSLKSEYGTGQDRDEQYLKNPLNNAKAAYKISGGHNFSPWSTYNSGAYTRYISSAQSAVDAVYSYHPPSPAPKPTTTTSTRQPVPSTANNTALAGGLVLVGYGFYRKYRKRM